MTVVSVLTPTITGREWFLDRCTRSVAANTYEGTIEHVVVDGDGLTATAAFAKALEESTGDYITPVSDDDWIAPHAIEVLAHHLDKHDVAFARTIIVSPSNTRLVDMGGAVMWRRTLTDRVGGFDMQWSFAGDTDLYARFAMCGARAAYHPEPLYFFTEHADHGSHVHREELEEELGRIYARYPGALPALAAVKRIGMLVPPSPVD